MKFRRIVDGLPGKEGSRPAAGQDEPDHYEEEQQGEAGLEQDGPGIDGNRRFNAPDVDQADDGNAEEYPGPYRQCRTFPVQKQPQQQDADHGQQEVV
ncbi:hypothetical protein Salpa_5766 [Sporomusa sp. KB1]|nr:hypothetical protein Salpa_5766 [Sporomusa sp. KB1]